MALSLFCPQQGTWFCSVHGCCTYFRKTQSEQENGQRKETRIGVCFGCLETGQMSKGCARRLTSQVCSVQHPTLLHNANRSQVTCKGDESKKEHRENTFGAFPLRGTARHGSVRLTFVFFSTGYSTWYFF